MAARVMELQEPVWDLGQIVVGLFSMRPCSAILMNEKRRKLLVLISTVYNRLAPHPHDPCTTCFHSFTRHEGKTGALRRQPFGGGMTATFGTNNRSLRLHRCTK